MSTLRKIQAAFSIALYLAAASLPCEPPGEFFFPAATTATEPSTRPAAPSPHASHGGRGMRGHGDSLGQAPGHAGHDAGHDVGHGVGHDIAHDAHVRTSHSKSDSISDEHSAHSHAPSPTSSQSASNASPDRTDQAVARESRGGTNRLALRAPCLCGCGETRGTVGGGSARLGTAVWTEAVVLLPERLPERALVLAPRMNSAAELPRDPIPI